MFSKTRKDLSILYRTSVYDMSIATLKRKTAEKYNNSSVGQRQFSLNGGYRNQGWVGQTSLSRSLPSTPMRGNVPRGHGGCCGTYVEGTIVQSAVTSQNDNRVIKSSVLDNDGMIATKYRWITRPQPYTSVKPDNNHNLNNQGDYIWILSRAQQCSTCAPSSPPSNVITCNNCNTAALLKSRINTPQSFARPYTNATTKPESDLVAIDQSNYITQSSGCCTNLDIEFNQLQNQTSTNSTPFACGLSS